MQAGRSFETLCALRTAAVWPHKRSACWRCKGKCGCIVAVGDRCLASPNQSLLHEHTQKCNVPTAPVLQTDGSAEYFWQLWDLFNIRQHGLQGIFWPAVWVSGLTGVDQAGMVRRCQGPQLALHSYLASWSAPACLCSSELDLHKHANPPSSCPRLKPQNWLASSWSSALGAAWVGAGWAHLDA